MVGSREMVHGNIGRRRLAPKWIAQPKPPKTSGPMPIFRREFTLAKPIVQATAYICGLGQYELTLNGRRVGDDQIDPPWTNYRKTCMYATYDVTGMVRRGPNALGVMLGNGMYNVPAGRYTKFRGTFGPPKLIMQLRLELADGSVRWIVSDENWKTTPGPITFSCTYGGEDYDAKLDPPGWRKPGFDDSTWTAAEVVDGPGGKLVSRSSPPLRLFETFSPKSITEPKPGVFVYDMGQNCSLIPSIRIWGKAGQTVRLTPAEQLHEDGTVNQAGVGKGAYMQYTLGAGGEQTWSPRFYYIGCQYLQVEGAVPVGRANPDNKPVLIELRTHHIRSSAPDAGGFSCSSELFNRIEVLVDWAVRSNLQHVLTDCPHREKLGWLEVSHLMFPSIAGRYDVENLYPKICRDMREAQLDDGMVPCIAPEYTVFRGGFRYSPAWASAMILNPWYTYQWFGDRRVLEDNYTAMKRYLAFMKETSEDLIARPGLGDWYDYVPGKRPGRSKLTPTKLVSTAMFSYDATVMAKTAAVLGHKSDAAEYNALAARIRDRFNQEFYHPDTKRYADGSQTAQAMALYMHLAPEADRPAVLKALVEDIRSKTNLQTAGDVGHRYLLRRLAEGGRNDVIFDINNRTCIGSYGGIIKQGWTSLPEAWDANPTSSMNHCMLGHVQEWFMRDLAGINPDPDAPGFKRVIIRPNVAGDLTAAAGWHDGPYGRIATSWRIDNGKLRLHVTVPANTTAEVYMPAIAREGVTESDKPVDQAHAVRFVRMQSGQVVLQVGSGDYDFATPMVTAK